MRAPAPSFGAVLQAFRQQLGADRPDHWKAKLTFEILDRWHEHPDREKIWRTIGPSFALPPAFLISELIQIRFEAEAGARAVKEAPAVEKKSRFRTKQHLKNRTYDQLANEASLLDDLQKSQDRLYGRKVGGGPKLGCGTDN